MWIFTTEGFFSIVMKQFNENDPPFQVRARVLGDLENLIDTCNFKKDIIHTPHADYHYRITVDKEELTKIMTRFTDDIDYDNFKSMIHGLKDQEHKLGAYYKVWQAMNDLQRD
jgi:hypothetical protein